MSHTPNLYQSRTGATVQTLVETLLLEKVDV